MAKITGVLDHSFSTEDLVDGLDNNYADIILDASEEVEVVIFFNYYPGRPEKVDCLPENAYPAEPAEVELKDAKRLVDDIMNHYARVVPLGMFMSGKGSEAFIKFKVCVEEYISNFGFNSEELMELVEDHLSE